MDPLLGGISDNIKRKTWMLVGELVLRRGDPICPVCEYSLQNIPYISLASSHGLDHMKSPLFDFELTKWLFLWFSLLLGYSVQTLGDGVHLYYEAQGETLNLWN